MTAALSLRPELSRHAWKIFKYLKKHAVGGILEPFRVETWLSRESDAEAIGELLDAGALRIDENDRYTLEEP